MVQLVGMVHCGIGIGDIKRKDMDKETISERNIKQGDEERMKEIHIKQ